MYSIKSIFPHLQSLIQVIVRSSLLDEYLIVLRLKVFIKDSFIHSLLFFLLLSLDFLETKMFKKLNVSRQGAIT